MPRVTITVPGKKPQPYRFQLDRQLTRLGRGSENDIVVDCASISVHHAEMERIDGGFQLRDLESTNGTKLEGERKRLIRLRNGIDVKIGDVEFDFELTEDELEALSNETPDDDSPIIAEEALDDEDLDLDDDYSDLDDDKPRHQPKYAHEIETGERSAMASFVMTLLLFVLAIAAFFAGLEIRHRKYTASAPDGPRSLIGEILSGKSANAPGDAGVEEEDPAPAGTE